MKKYFNSHYTEMLFVTTLFLSYYCYISVWKRFQFSLYWDAFCNEENKIRDTMITIIRFQFSLYWDAFCNRKLSLSIWRREQNNFNSHYTEMLFVTKILEIKTVYYAKQFQFSLYWDAFCNSISHWDVRIWRDRISILTILRCFL